MKDENTIEYIQIEWADIHHSRQQEWQALGVLAGVFYAMVNLQALEARFFLGLLGILSSFLGACISWQHHIIFRDKISLITKLERQMGIQYPARDVLFPVQVLLFLLFGGIASALIGATLGYLTEILRADSFRLYAYLAGLVAFILFLGYALVQRLKALRVKSYGFTQPFCAEMEELERCIERLGTTPLKLVASGLLSRPGVKEVSWESSKWTWHSDDNQISKLVLLNQRDVFQFSLANASSKQDWHYHKNAFEVYVSNHCMDLEYEEQGVEKKKQALHVGQGLLIIPPGISHQISLSGNTFVFQATLAAGNLGEDKVIIKGR